MKKDSNYQRRWIAAGKGSITFEPIAACEKCWTKARYVTSGQCVQCSKDRVTQRSRDLRDRIRLARKE